MATESVLQTLQKITTMSYRLDELEKRVIRKADESDERHTRAETEINELRVRVVHLESSREADRSHAQTELERFQIAVERAELRLQKMLPAEGGA